MRSGISYCLIVMALMFVFIVQINSANAAVLYDNGPLVNSPGTGSGGADESILQNGSLGMSTFGFGHQVAADNRIADDFTINDPQGWDMTTITFYAYQTGSPTTSTITQVNLRIWDGPPAEVGSNVVFGDTTTNLLASTQWSNIYRVSETTTGATNRPIMENIVNVDTHLDLGTYWLDWQTGGTLGSGPWAPPITITGLSATGNGFQSIDAGVTYANVLDGTISEQQGFPFIVEGDVTFVAPIPTLSEWGAMILMALIMISSIVMLKKRQA